ncbi:MAG: hypothetical protein AAF657_02495 [Acidobacteriota bacterium]
MQLTLFQNLIAKLELSLPGLLPALESIEQTVPLTSRLLLGVTLLAGLGLLRHLRESKLQGATVPAKFR